jgi:uncharacterized protein YegL
MSNAPSGAVPKMPGGAISARPARFFWLVDCSGSMDGAKIGQLNFSINEAIPGIRSLARSNPRVLVEMQVLSFSKGARWMTPEPVRIEDFVWQTQVADGHTDMGRALHMLAEALSSSKMPARGYTPVVVLLSDGMPTDPEEFDSGLEAVLAQPWGRAAIRLSIAIGRDADVEVLERFVSDPAIGVLQADNTLELAEYIRWASIDVLNHSVASHSTSDGRIPTIVTPRIPRQSVDVLEF